MECGFDDHGSRDSGEWDEYYSKEVRSQRKRSPLLLVGACVGISGLALLVTAAMLADEDESVFGASLRLLRLS